jgi:kynurenine 3-monooxygenase
MTKIAIVGAGLCGSLLALRMAQRGIPVDVYERRPDSRTQKIASGRSINLALSDRGLAALRLCGMDQAAAQIAIPMLGRGIHNLGTDEVLYAPYSGREGEYINSISRRYLNELLLTEAEKYSEVAFHFRSEITQVRDDHRTLVIGADSAEKHYDLIIGTDGANSAVRDRFVAQSAKIRFDYAVKYLETGYKELELAAGAHHSFRLSKNHLHIWPRDGFMMIALPNLDGSFTLTLFMPFEGKNSFASLESREDARAFISAQFPDLSSYADDLADDYMTHPMSSLSTLKCYPWAMSDSLLLMGDAAHAIVPFYGQGMNASFEDVMILDTLMDQYGEDWSTILLQYQTQRKKDTDAIADLASDNFYEMRDATADPVFLKKRKIELRLEQTFPDYFSKYSLVTFREDIPYSRAMEQGRAQDLWLMELAMTIDDPTQVDIYEIKRDMDLFLKNK